MGASLNEAGGEGEGTASFSDVGPRAMEKCLKELVIVIVAIINICFYNLRNRLFRFIGNSRFSTALAFVDTSSMDFHMD